MMDFAALPPEVNSGLIYAGPGPESLLAAATAWDGLAEELRSASTSYGSVVANLSSQWSGPSSAAMSAAVAPFVEWLADAAGQAQQVGAAAVAAVQAYESAFVATVPPALIAANRSQLATLLATNVFGQHTAGIAALEAAYSQMWAQDAAAMYAYAAAAAAATRVTPFTPAPRTTDAAGQGAAAAAAQAAGASSQSALSANGPLGMITQLLQNMATYSTSANTGLGNFLDGGTGLSSIWNNLINATRSSVGYLGYSSIAMASANFAMGEFRAFFIPLKLLPEIMPGALGAGLGTAGMSAGLGGAVASPVAGSLIHAVAADVGSAPSVGALSVPQGWATATPAIRLAATSLPATASAAAPMASGLGGLLNPAALGSMTGGALGAPGPRLINGADVRGGGVGGRGRAPVQLDRVIAQLQKQKDAVQHWQIDEAGLDDLLDELAKKPGFHAVHLTKTDKSEATQLKSPLAGVGKGCS